MQESVLSLFACTVLDANPRMKLSWLVKRDAQRVRHNARPHVGKLRALRSSTPEAVDSLHTGQTKQIPARTR